MWIVRVALQRPYTFIMLAVLIVLMGGYAILNTCLLYTSPSPRDCS